MKKITTLYDQVLQQPYDLYQIEAKELVNTILNTYEKEGLTPLFVQRFNTEAKLSRNNYTYPDILREINEMEQGVRQNHENNSYHSLASKQELIEKFERAFLNGEIINERDNKQASLGYELMPFALSVKGRDVEYQLHTLELLDGFRRVFYTTDIPDGDVLVKVYDHLSDKDWVSAMIVFNSWKFADSKNPLLFLDRGFKLGLFKRYDIDFSKLIGYEYNHGEKNMKTYLNHKPYYTLWQNDQLANDIRFMQQVKLHRPLFHLKKKKKEEVVDLAQEPFNYPTFLEKINEYVYHYLGELRRKETNQIIEGENIKRKQASFDDYQAFLEEEELQEAFIKLYNMKVPGHIENYVRNNLKPLIGNLIDASFLVKEKV